MKVIVAGSRHISDYQLVSAVISNTISKYNIPITELISGCARGVDALGEQWAQENNIPINPFPAQWDDLSAPNALIRTNQYGKEYNARAGFDRNRDMAEHGDVLILIWDGKSRGSAGMRKISLELGVKVYECII